MAIGGCCQKDCSERQEFGEDHLTAMGESSVPASSVCQHIANECELNLFGLNWLVSAAEW